MLALAALGYLLAVILVGGASAHTDRCCRAAGGTLPTTATEPTSTSTAPILPITSITPGALNPRVRQGTIRPTICKPGWTATIRPRPSYTTALKIKPMPVYEEGGPTSAYEEDDLVPLELGGAPRNPKNLWPEPRTQADVSDPLETKLKHRVCRDLMTLVQARAEIRTFKNENG